MPCRGAEGAQKGERRLRSSERESGKGIRGGRSLGIAKKNRP